MVFQTHWQAQLSVLSLAGGCVCAPLAVSSCLHPPFLLSLHERWHPNLVKKRCHKQRPCRRKGSSQEIQVEWSWESTTTSRLELSTPKPQWMQTPGQHKSWLVATFTMIHSLVSDPGLWKERWASYWCEHSGPVSVRTFILPFRFEGALPLWGPFIWDALGQC